MAGRARRGPGAPRGRSLPAQESSVVVLCALAPSAPSNIRGVLPSELEEAMRR